MIIIQSLALAVIGYFILMLVTTNLLGLVVRGFFHSAEMGKLKDEAHPFVKEEIKKTTRANNVLNIFFAIIFLVLLFLLYKYINIWAVVAVLLLVTARVPDLLWEIRHGGKPSKELLPKGGIYNLTMLISWTPLPVLWWAFYTWLS